MKKQILSLLLVLLIANICKSQIAYYNHQVSVQYGSGSTTYLDISLWEENPPVTEVLNRFGPIGVSYNYSVTPRLRLGGSFVYQTQTKTYIQYDYLQPSIVSYAYTSKSNAFVFSGDFLFIYGIRHKVRPYGKISLGYENLSFENEYSIPKNTTFSENNNYKGLVLQFTPIGMEFGEQICGFVELGIGYQGIFLGGIRGRF
jgi:hypothetical protein